jgi:hypothetical protein
MTHPLARFLAYAVAITISLAFLYPYWWMVLGASARPKR